MYKKTQTNRTPNDIGQLFCVLLDLALPSARGTGCMARGAAQEQNISFLFCGKSDLGSVLF
jgi:hypothetical protein